MPPSDYEPSPHEAGDINFEVYDPADERRREALFARGNGALPSASDCPMPSLASITIQARIVRPAIIGSRT